MAIVLPLCKTAKSFRWGTPDEILNNPANDYVRTFFRGVDISQVFSAKDIARRSPVGLIRKTPGFGPRSALKLLQDEDREFGYVIERGNKFVGIVSIDSLKAALSQAQGIEAALIDESLAVDAQTPLSELLSHVGQAPCAVPVVDEEQQYVGIISKRMLLQALDREGGKQWLNKLIRGIPRQRRIAPRKSADAWGAPSGRACRWRRRRLADQRSRRLRQNILIFMTRSIRR
ncbi:glycine betaine transporter ATP-binding subunit [Citrobacter koseri]|uniref:Glycine betaine transporter ATP-binding subunit n=1 Tax=Citrobacter koseri TaxID=545 RepID=A0A2X2WP28_CITKO|nr:glycine betaine transporter ATP-binding subunit [Citrobacter koseri]